MLPLVRETHNAPVAVTPKPTGMVPVNAIDSAGRAPIAKAKAPETQDDSGSSLVVARRKRWARLSNRH